MSTLLYALGHLVARRRWVVLLSWVFLAVVVVALAGVTGGKLISDFTIPGTESQRGIDTLAQRFPQASGTTGQIVFSTRSDPVKTQEAAIEERITAVGKVKHVSSVDDPFASGAVGTISTDGRDALAAVQFDVSVTDLPPGTVDLVEKAAAPPAGAGFTSTLGGAMYTSTGAGLSSTELIGVAVAFLVLAVTFSSLLAAGLPLLTAALGVGITLAGVLTVASFTTVSTTTPTLALMIGLAVGIDYGLFIVTRHRRQLVGGMAVEESIAQAAATAGSAVVFAGTTVIIALCGLSVAQIPFLSVMGLAAAAGVALAVAVALTLLPAVLALFGEHLRPRPTSRAARRDAGGTGARRTVGSRWVALVTKVPVLTVVLVLAGITVLALPVKDLTLALSDNGSAEVGTPQRTTYDLVAREFGPGYNAPLLVTADVITSTDPRGAVDDLADAIKTMPGVAAITKQTPNPTGDLGLVRVVPEWSQSDPRTADLVQRIRAREPALESSLKIDDVLVTGQTAVAIDVSERLSGALVPFGVVIVGLALVLLAIVFRSVAVPVKATLGFLLSIGAALGAVTATFVWGWFAGPLGITLTGPVVSFLPIILMGVLFGLAMDYEVFLVSQIREDYVHHHDARHAVTTGFTSSARVVTAAAVIMIAVFAAFIPHGDSTIKPIALGLAVGVFVDAFLVRMTLVPAVLALLGDAAWWIPKALDRALPSIDVEGQALVRHVEQVAWEERNGAVAVRAERVVLGSADAPVEVDLSVQVGTLVAFGNPDPLVRSGLTWALAGRHQPLGGQLSVLGRVLPEEAAAVRRRVEVVTAPDPAEDALTVRRYLTMMLLARSSRLWPRRREARRCLDRAVGWFASVGSPADAAALERRTLGSLTVLQRRVLALSAVATSGPELVVVEEADSGIDPEALRRLGALCSALVRDDGTTVVLVGLHVRTLATPVPVQEDQPRVEPEVEPESEGGPEPEVEPEPEPEAEVDSEVAAEVEPEVVTAPDVRLTPEGAPR